jgi:hypothetical protein
MARANKDFKYTLCSSIFVVFILLLTFVNLLKITFTNENKEIKSENITLSYWKQTISDNPYYKDGYIEYGRELLKSGDNTSALTMFTDARKLDPNN